MLFHVSRQKYRKIKALQLLAILSVAEGRRVSSNILAGNDFARNAEGLARGRYEDGAKHTSSPTAAVRTMQTAMENPELQKISKLFAESIDAALTTPEHLKVIMDEPGLLEQSKLLAEQIKALTGEPKVRELQIFFTEAAENLMQNRHLQEHAKLASEQLSAVMDDTKLRQQSELFLAQLEAMMTGPQDKRQELQECANVLSEHLKAVTEAPELQKHLTLLVEHIKLIVKHPEVQEQAKLASEKLNAITGDQGFIERLELVSEQLKAILEHGDKLLAYLISHRTDGEPTLDFFSLAELQWSSSGASFLPPSFPARKPAAVASRSAALRPSAPSVTGRRPLQIWKPQVRARPPPVMLGDRPMETEQACRTLGVDESAGYEEIVTRFDELEAIYGGDTTKLEELQRAKDTILDSILRQRMEGSLKAQYKGGVAREDLPKPTRPPIWNTLNEHRKKLFEFPSRKHAVKVFSLLLGASLVAWVNPRQAGLLLMLSTVSAFGFMYNRGEREPVRDEFGEIGEIKPMQKKPCALAAAITATIWFWGYFMAKQLVSQPGLEMVMRTTLISCALIVPSLFVKVHPVFA